MIRATDVCVRAGDKQILSNVSATIEPGEVVAAIGCNGAGKSTLLRVLAGDRNPDEGSVSLDGVGLQRWSKLDLARRRAVLSQATSVAFSLSVRDLVGLGRDPHRGRCGSACDAAIVQRALAATRLAGLADRRFETLSGGEQQRAHLARVLAQLDSDGSERQTRFLLLDEPTSSQDLHQQRGLISLVREVAAAGVGVFTVVHDLNIASLVADRVIVLREGKLVAAGETKDVLTADVLRTAFDVEIDVVVSAGGRRIFVPT